MYSILDDLKERAIRDFSPPPAPAPGEKPPTETELKAKVWIRDAHIDALKYELASARAKRMDAAPAGAPVATYDAQRAYADGVRVGSRRLHRRLRAAVQRLAAAVADLEAALAAGEVDGNA